MLIVAAFKALVFVIPALFLRAGFNIRGLKSTNNAVAIRAILIGIGILIPENDVESGFSEIPQRLIFSAAYRHGSRKRRLPLVKRVTRLGGFTDGDGRTVTGVNRFKTVTAIQIELHQVVVAVVVNLDFRAAVCRNGCIGGINQLVEAVIRLRKISADQRSGIARLSFGFSQRILCAGDVLLIMLDGDLDLGGVISDNVGLFCGSINLNRCLIRRVAYDDRAGDRLRIGAAGGNRGAPRIGGLCAVRKLVVDKNGVGGDLGLRLSLAVVGRGGVVYRGGVGERGRGDIRRQVICRSSVGRRGGVRSRGLFHSGLRGDDDRLAYRLGLGDDGGGLRSLRRSGDGRFVRDLHRDGVRVLHCLARGETAAEIRRAAVQQVRHERVADVQRHAVRAGDVRPHVAADLDLPLVDAGAGGGNRGERELIILCKLDRMRNKPVRAVDKEILVGSGGGDEGGGHEAEGKSAAEKQR